MSQHDWKPGDFAMVEIGSIDLLDDINGSKRFRLKAGEYDWNTVEVRGQVLRPLPTTDPITDLERAVVNKTMAWRDIYYSDPGVPYPQYVAARDEAIWAADALNATRTPPAPVDPITALRNAWEAPRGLLWAEGVQAALDAAETAWKGSKA
jgi:hypothetical protein